MVKLSALRAHRQRGEAAVLIPSPGEVSPAQASVRLCSWKGEGTELRRPPARPLARIRYNPTKPLALLKWADTYFMKYFRAVGLALILAACSQATGSDPTTAPKTTTTAEVVTSTTAAPIATATTPVAPATTSTTRLPTTSSTTQPQFTRSEENAIESAESYLEVSSFSRSGLKDQLMYEGFTAEQATYGVDKTGL